MNKISKNDNTSYTCLIFYLNISLFRSRLLVAFWKKILFWKFHVTPWNTPRPPIIFVFQNFCKEADNNGFLGRSSIQHVREIFRKPKFSYPMICTCTCEYHGGKTKSFAENFAYALNGWPLLELVTTSSTCFMISGYKTWIKHSYVVYMTFWTTHQWIMNVSCNPLTTNIPLI